MWHLKCNFFVFINISASRLARKVYLVSPESPEQYEASRTYLLFLACSKLDLLSTNLKVILVITVVTSITAKFDEF